MSRAVGLVFEDLWPVAEHWERESGYDAPYCGWLDGDDREGDRQWEADFLLLGSLVADRLQTEQDPYPGWYP
jgi:hypothetical protein